MAYFKDKNGEEWIIQLTVGLVEDVKEKVNFDLDDILKNPEHISTILLAEPKKLVEILYVICEDEIKQRSLEPRDFGRLFNRETIDNATNAFLDAILDFYPRGSAGKALRERLPALLELMDKKMSETATAGMNDQIEKIMNGQVKVS